MRKVLFKKWIPIQVENGKTVQGTRCWQSDYENMGVFHQWASAYEESDRGFGNYTVALIELPNGEIESVLPFNIKFIS